MQNKIDVIGIGAINFDYIFSSPQSDIIYGKRVIDDGEEIFIKEHVFKQHLAKTQKHSELIQTQVGGSALLTIRTLKTMCSQLRTAYVGVYGNMPDYINGSNIPQTESELLDHISSYVDDITWLFNDEQLTGCSLVKLHNRSRQFIHILTGANNSLLNNIKRSRKIY